jgi:signal transduction histidine kinase/ActR/RegA family two-component response regulator
MSVFARLTHLLPHRSVQARLAWATGLSGVLFAVLLSFWFARDQRQQLQQAVSESARREARVMGQIVSAALSERQSQIEQLAAQPEVSSGLMDAGALRLLLERTRAFNPEFEWLGFADAHGLITTATGARLEQQGFSQQPWFQRGRHAAWIGRPHEAGPLARFLPVDVDGRPARLIDMAVPVIDYDGRTIGVLVGMLNWRWIQDMHQKMTTQDAGLQHALLQAPSGEVFIGPSQMVGQKLRPPGFDRVLSQGTADVLPWPDVGEQLTAMAPVRWSMQEGQEPWLMVLRQDPRLAFGPAEKLWQKMLMGGLLASLVFMWLSWWLAGRIAQPLRTLSDTALALRQGQPAHFEVDDQHADEIAALSGSLRDMHADLQTRMSELAAYRDHLEDKIAQRTEQLSAALDKAEAATRAKSAFIANMSHEIRTPMNAIMGMGYLLQQSDLLPGQSERLKVMEQAASHLLEIINNILDLSKIEAGMFELVPDDFDLQPVLQKAVDLVMVRAREKQLLLNLDQRGCPPRVRGDATRLSQILLNLLSNAVKFSEQGQVRLVVRPLPPDPAATDREGLRIEVHDQGVGIAEQDVERLFNAFVQADESSTRRYGGTGLGLAITRSLVELMGGRIGVHSVPGQGSVFWCEVRLAHADVVPVAEQEARHEIGIEAGHMTVNEERQEMRQAMGQGAGHHQPVLSMPSALPVQRAMDILPRQFAGARLLLAEDNPVNQMLVVELLDMVGLQVTTAVNGAEAVEQVRKADFDLVLMDVHMPEMDGLIATRRIRQLPQGRDIPILAMTASVLQQEQAACYEAGMNAHLAKPIDPQALYAALLHWLSQPRADRALLRSAS